MYDLTLIGVFRLLFIYARKLVFVVIIIIIIIIIYTAVLSPVAFPALPVVTVLLWDSNPSVSLSVKLPPGAPSAEWPC